jgi:hypothetical protein
MYTKKSKPKWTRADKHAWSRGFTPYGNATKSRLVDNGRWLLFYDEDAWQAALQGRVDEICAEAELRVSCAEFGNQKSNPLIYAWVTASYRGEKFTLYAAAVDADERHALMRFCRELPALQTVLGANLQKRAMDIVMQNADAKFRRRNPEVWRRAEQLKKARLH